MVLHARDSLSKRRLKMWIRLLGVTRASERHLREFLRVEHGTTLPRFDVMAALWRRREGLTMSELGRLLLVSGGNVTVIVDGLEREGLVIRAHSSADRRTVAVSLTERGLAEFEREIRQRLAVAAQYLCRGQPAHSGRGVDAGRAVDRPAARVLARDDPAP
jgi:DNA-binding MarR family transcriptional regulator